MIDNSHSLKYSNSSGDIFQISEAALNTLFAYRQTATDNPEAGGIMLGRFLLDSKNVVVDEVTIPTSTDKRSRFRFFRDNCFHLEFAGKVWRNSRGRINYLGEWHTHPQEEPTPSSIDVKDWLRKIKDDRYDGEHLYFVIVGTKKITAWQGNKTGCNVEKLLEIID